MNSVDERAMNNSPIYIAINEDTIGQHTITVEEKTEWNFNEFEIFRSTPIVESFLHRQEQLL